MPTARRAPAGSGRYPPYGPVVLQTLRPVFHSMTEVDVSFAPTTSVLSPENPRTTKPSTVPSCAPSSAERIIAFHGPPAPPERTVSARREPSALVVTQPPA